MVFSVKTNENEALDFIDTLLEGLSLTDPVRTVFENLRVIFVRDFSIDSNIKGYSNDDITEMVKDRLNHKDVMGSLHKLIEIVEEHKVVMDKWRVDRIDMENVSMLSKSVSYDISSRLKFQPTTLEVMQGRDVDRTIYYAIGNRVRAVERITNVTDGNIVINHSYTYRLSEGSAGAKKRDFLAYMTNMTTYKDLEDITLSSIQDTTEYIRIVETSEVSLDTIMDSVTVIDSNTGILLSINKALVKPSNIHMGSNSLTILTNDINLKGTKYYRVIGKDKVISGTYSYSADNPAYTLVYVVDGVSVEEDDRSVIRTQYHIYSNKAEADNLANVYTDTIRRISDRRDFLITKEDALVKREKTLLKKEKAVLLNESDSTKKLAEANKVNAEESILKSTAEIERARAAKAEVIADAEIEEKIQKILKTESDVEKNEADTKLIDLKTIAAGIGIGATGYTIYKQTQGSNFLGSVLKKILM